MARDDADADPLHEDAGWSSQFEMHAVDPVDADPAVDPDVASELGAGGAPAAPPRTRRPAQRPEVPARERLAAALEAFRQLSDDNLRQIRTTLLVTTVLSTGLLVWRSRLWRRATVADLPALCAGQSALRGHILGVLPDGVMLFRHAPPLRRVLTRAVEGGPVRGRPAGGAAAQYLGVWAALAHANPKALAVTELRDARVDTEHAEDGVGSLLPPDVLPIRLLGVRPAVGGVADGPGAVGPSGVEWLEDHVWAAPRTVEARFLWQDGERDGGRADGGGGSDVVPLADVIAGTSLTAPQAGITATAAVILSHRAHWWSWTAVSVAQEMVEAGVCGSRRMPDAPTHEEAEAWGARGVERVAEELHALGEVEAGADEAEDRRARSAARREMAGRAVGAVGAAGHGLWVATSWLARVATRAVAGVRAMAAARRRGARTTDDDNDGSSSSGRR